MTSLSCNPNINLTLFADAINLFILLILMLLVGIIVEIYPVIKNAHNVMYPTFILHMYLW